MTYTLRRTWPDDPDRPDDYVVRYDGEDVGRIYKHGTPHGERWLWAVYVQRGVAVVEGVPPRDLAGSLDEAKAAFRASFEKMIAL